MAINYIITGEYDGDPNADSLRIVGIKTNNNFDYVISLTDNILPVDLSITPVNNNILIYDSVSNKLKYGFSEYDILSSNSSVSIRSSIGNTIVLPIASSTSAGIITSAMADQLLSSVDASHTHSAEDINSGILPSTVGGTGYGSFSNNDILIGTSDNLLSKKVLMSGSGINIEQHANTVVISTTDSGSNQAIFKTIRHGSDNKIFAANNNDSFGFTSSGIAELSFGSNNLINIHAKQTDLVIQHNTSNAVIQNTTGSDVTIQLATNTTAGLMSPNDKYTLNNLSAVIGDELNTYIQTTNARLSDIENDILSNKNSIDTIILSLNDFVTHNVLNTELNSLETKLDSKIVTIDAKVNNHENRIVVLEGIIPDITADISEIQTSLADIEDDITQLQNAEDFNTAIVPYNTKIENNETNISDLHDIVSALASETNEDIEHDIQDLKDHVSTLEITASSLQSQITTLRNDHNDLENTVTAILNSLEQELLTVQSDIFNIIEQINTLADNMLTVTDVEEIIQNAISHLTGDSGQGCPECWTTQQLKDLIDSEIADIRSDIATLSIHHTQITNDISNINDTISEIIQRLTQIENTYITISDLESLDILSVSDVISIIQNNNYSILSSFRTDIINTITNLYANCECITPEQLQAIQECCDNEIISPTTTTQEPITIDPGGWGYGVGIYEHDLSCAGVQYLGTDDPKDPNYGNYLFSDGSIAVFIPAFYYKFGSLDSPRYPIFGNNAIDTQPLSAFSSIEEAKSHGYTLHRAFIDGGKIESGFFIDKFVNTKNNTNTAGRSIQGARPISLFSSRFSHYASNYYRSEDMVGCEGRALDAITLAKARSPAWTCGSAFQYSALAFISLSHGQSSELLGQSTVDACAWYSPYAHSGGILPFNPTNFPKGCNKSLSDVNDPSVVYASANEENPNKPLAGAIMDPLEFAKTTHNGQASGVCDLNGSMFEVAIGVTTPGNSSTELLNLYQDSSLYIAKPSSYIADFTVGFSTDSTDHWGTTAFLNSSPMYDKIDNVFWWTNTGTDQYVGNINTRVFHTDAHSPWDITPAYNSTAIGLPLQHGMSSSGTPLFGRDSHFQLRRQNLTLLSGGYWNSEEGAGLFSRAWNFTRWSSHEIIGFRSATYPSALLKLCPTTTSDSTTTSTTEESTATTTSTTTTTPTPTPTGSLYCYNPTDTSMTIRYSHWHTINTVTLTINGTVVDSSEQSNNGTVQEHTVTDLTPSTSYTFALWHNGSILTHLGDYAERVCTTTNQDGTVGVSGSLTCDSITTSSITLDYVFYNAAETVKIVDINNTVLFSTTLINADNTVTIEHLDEDTSYTFLLVHGDDEIIDTATCKTDLTPEMSGYINCGSTTHSSIQVNYNFANATKSVTIVKHGDTNTVIFTSTNSGGHGHENVINLDSETSYNFTLYHGSDEIDTIECTTAAAPIPYGNLDCDSVTHHSIVLDYSFFNAVNQVTIVIDDGNNTTVFTSNDVHKNDVVTVPNLNESTPYEFILYHGSDILDTVVCSTNAAPIIQDPIGELTCAGSTTDRITLNYQFSNAVEQVSIIGHNNDDTTTLYRVFNTANGTGDAAITDLNYSTTYSFSLLHNDTVLDTAQCTTSAPLEFAGTLECYNTTSSTISVDYYWVSASNPIEIGIMNPVTAVYEAASTFNTTNSGSNKRLHISGLEQNTQYVILMYHGDDTVTSVICTTNELLDPVFSAELICHSRTHNSISLDYSYSNASEPVKILVNIDGVENEIYSSTATNGDDILSITELSPETPYMFTLLHGTETFTTKQCTTTVYVEPVVAGLLDCRSMYHDRIILDYEFSNATDTITIVREDNSSTLFNSSNSSGESTVTASNLDETTNYVFTLYHGSDILDTASCNTGIAPVPTGTLYCSTSGTSSVRIGYEFSHSVPGTNVYVVMHNADGTDTTLLTLTSTGSSYTTFYVQNLESSTVYNFTLYHGNDVLDTTSCSTSNIPNPVGSLECVSSTYNRITFDYSYNHASDNIRIIATHVDTGTEINLYSSYAYSNSDTMSFNDLISDSDYSIKLLHGQTEITSVICRTNEYPAIISSLDCASSTENSITLEYSFRYAVDTITIELQNSDGTTEVLFTSGSNRVTSQLIVPGLAFETEYTFVMKHGGIIIETTACTTTEELLPEGSLACVLSTDTAITLNYHHNHVTEDVTIMVLHPRGPVNVLLTSPVSENSGITKELVVEGLQPQTMYMFYMYMGKTLLSNAICLTTDEHGTETTVDPNLSGYMECVFSKSSEITFDYMHTGATLPIDIYVVNPDTSYELVETSQVSDTNTGLIRKTITNLEPESSYTFVMFHGSAIISSVMCYTLTEMDTGGEDPHVVFRTLDECNDWNFVTSSGYKYTKEVWDISSVPKGTLMHFEYNVGTIPNRIWIHYGSQEIVNTGWRGSNVYNGDSLYTGGISGPGQERMCNIMVKGDIDTLTISIYGPNDSAGWYYWLMCGGDCSSLELDEPGDDFDLNDPDIITELALTECDVWEESRSLGYNLTEERWDISSVPEGESIHIAVDAFSVPDRFWVFYDGVEVLHTGWRGAMMYDNEMIYPGGVSEPSYKRYCGIVTKGLSNELIVKIHGIEITTTWVYWLRCGSECEELGPIDRDPENCAHFRTNDVDNPVVRTVDGEGLNTYCNTCPSFKTSNEVYLKTATGNNIILSC